MKNNPYSKSLKKMMKQQLIHSIHVDFLQPKVLNKNQKKSIQRKSQINQINEYKRSFHKQIDKIVKQYVQKQQIQVQNHRLSRKKHLKNYRIVTESSELKDIEIKKNNQKINQESSQRNNNEIKYKLPPVKSTIETRRTKTLQVNPIDDTYQIDVNKFIKHYRAGIASFNGNKFKCQKY